RTQGFSVRLQEIFRPLRARERPFVLGAQHEFLAGMADIERHARLLVPARVLALEEVSEKPFLQRLAIGAVEMREVRVAVHFEPFLFRAGAQPTFEIAARVQAHAAPVPGGEQGGLDILEFRDAPAVVVVKVATAFRFAWRVGNVFGEFFLRQRFGPATYSPVTTLVFPRVPTPYCTLATWRGCQLLRKSLRMPPWRQSSR